MTVFQGQAITLVVDYVVHTGGNSDAIQLLQVSGNLDRPGSVGVEGGIGEDPDRANIVTVGGRMFP